MTEILYILCSNSLALNGECLPVGNAYTWWVKKSKLLILSEYVNKTEKIGGIRTNTDIYRENGALSDILHEIFYVTIICLNILRLKAVNEITARQKQTSLCKHDVIKVCSIEYLTSHK